MTSDKEVYLAGSVAGAAHVGDTVHRPSGPWTPAVHALLGYLAPRVPDVPRVFGYDEQGREVLSYLPGRVVHDDHETLGTGQLVSVARWTRAFHDAVAGFSHPGPWRFSPAADATLIGHNDIAPYNVCFEGDEVTGVIDWDMAGRRRPWTNWRSSRGTAYRSSLALTLFGRAWCPILSKIG